MKPEILNDTQIDFDVIKDICQDYIDCLENGESTEGFKDYIFETTIEALYGKEVWEYINSKL